jgi:hypothetical protein
MEYFLALRKQGMGFVLLPDGLGLAFVGLSVLLTVLCLIMLLPT